MQVRLAFFAAILASQSEAGTISFDYTLSGTPIDAMPTYAETRPSVPIPGPIVSEYRPAGVTFTGGVVLSYGAYGGPTDTRTSSGNFLESPPNLLATSDYFPLNDGSIMPGSIEARLEFPASVVSTSIRNGFNASTFGMFAYRDGNLVDFSSTSLGPFLSGSQDGTITVSAPEIDEVRIVSDQAVGSKNFGLDGFSYVPRSLDDALHASFTLGAATAQPSERDQEVAQQNFEQVFDSAFGIEKDGNVTAGEAIFFSYEQIDTFLNLWNVFKGNPITPLPFIIIPCDSGIPGIGTYANCGGEEHTQITASLFDLWEYDVALEFEAGNVDVDLLSSLVGSPSIVSFEADGFTTLGSITLSNFSEDGDSVRADFQVASITDVSSTLAPIPLPAPALTLLGSLFVLYSLSRGRRQLKAI